MPRDDEIVIHAAFLGHAEGGRRVPPRGKKVGVVRARWFVMEPS